ncbi:MAG TPA: hypothetical protein VM166_11005 [Gemmatimonadaceae bacterium]|nr:hypothetical protein [Gemmatimonadaceae bacterium]
MKPMFVCVSLLFVLSACESTSDPLGGFGGTGGGGAITQADASGNWSFTVRRTTTLACSGGSLADGQILTAHLDVVTAGSLNASASTWQNPPNAAARPLSGSVRFSDGLADLIMTSSAGNTASGMELRGTIVSDGTFTGTLTDPAPGLTPIFSVSGCEYSTTGTKTS